jgi:carbonic anhydrase
MCIDYTNTINTFEDEEERFNKFVEVNAQEQVLAKTIVQNAWRNGQDPLDLWFKLRICN